MPDAPDRPNATDDSARWHDHRTLRTSAPPERAWAAWAEPDAIAGWFADAAHGTAEPGGTLVHEFTSFGMKVEYRVLEAEPGKRLVLEGTSPHGLPFRQEIRIRTEGGDTVVDLVHSGFSAGADWDAELEGIDSGWTLALAVLKHYLEHHFGRTRRSRLVMRPIPAGAADVQPYFRRGDGLAAWLTETGELADPAPGAPVELVLAGGTPLSGRVLADSGLELALEWSEIEGVLELKTFPLGPEQRAVAVRVSSWRLDDAEMDRLQQAFEHGVEALATAVSG